MAFSEVGAALRATPGRGETPPGYPSSLPGSSISMQSAPISGVPSGLTDQSVGEAFSRGGVRGEARLRRGPPVAARDVAADDLGRAAPLRPRPSSAPCNSPPQPRPGMWTAAAIWLRYGGRAQAERKFECLAASASLGAGCDPPITRAKALAGGWAPLLSLRGAFAVIRPPRLGGRAPPGQVPRGYVRKIRRSALPRRRCRRGRRRLAAALRQNKKPTEVVMPPQQRRRPDS